MLAKISKHNRSTNKKKTNKKKTNEKDVCTLLASESQDWDAALEVRGRMCRAKGGVVCDDRLYTLYTVVAAVGGEGAASHHGLFNSFVS